MLTSLYVKSQNSCLYVYNVLFMVCSLNSKSMKIANCGQMAQVSIIYWEKKRNPYSEVHCTLIIIITIKRNK